MKPLKSPTGKSFKDINGQFKEFRDDYCEFVSGIATLSFKTAKTSKNLVVIKDEITLKRLVKYWKEWDKYIDALSAFPEQCNVNTEKYTNPAWVFHDVHTLKIYNHITNPTENLGKKELLYKVIRQKKITERKLDKLPENELPHATHKVKQCELAIGIIKRDSDSETYRWRREVADSKQVAIYRDSTKVSRYKNGRALSKKLVEDPKDPDFLYNQRLKNTGIFILDLEDKVEILEVVPDSRRRKRKDSLEVLEKGDLTPLPLEGIISGKVYRLKDIERSKSNAT